MPLLTRIRLLAVKAEVSAGVAQSVSSTDATIPVFGPEMTPDDNTNEREYPGAYGSDKSEPGAKSGRLTFEVEMVGGTSSPTWATTLLPLCGMTESTGTWTFARNSTTGTLVLYEDGVKRTLYGARGTFTLMFPVGGICRVRFEFIGKYKDEQDASILTPTFDTARAPMFGGGTNTVSIGSFAPNLSNITIDAGNVLVLRESPNDPGGDSSGIYAAEIVARKTLATLDPESTVVATQDWDALRAAKTEQTLTVVVGTAAASNRATISSTHFQVQKRPVSDRNGIRVKSITGQCNEPAPLSIVFS